MPHEAVVGVIGLICAAVLVMLHRTVVEGIYKIAVRGEQRSRLPGGRRWAVPVTQRNAAITAWVLIALVCLISLVYLAVAVAGLLG